MAASSAHRPAVLEPPWARRKASDVKARGATSRGRPRRRGGGERPGPRGRCRDPTRRRAGCKKKKKEDGAQAAQHGCRRAEEARWRSAQGTASFVRDHPLWLAALIVVKSMQLEARLMTLPWFQDSVLPAWKALTSRASGRFLFFLVLSMLGTLFAFVSLPRHGLTFVEIPGLWLSPASRGNLSNDLASALYIVEKMTLMGDFSEDMIQGTQWKPSYNRTDSTGYLTQVPLEDVDGDVRLSNDLPFFSLFFALLYGVVMMNLYIGILSEEYNKASDDLQRLTGSHRITVSIPVLLVKHGLAGLGLCRAERCAFRQRELRQGFWFALPRPRGDLARPEDGPEEEGREGHGAPS